MSIVTGGLGRPRSGAIVAGGLGRVTVPAPPEPEPPVLGSFVLPPAPLDRVQRARSRVVVDVTVEDTSRIRYTTPVEVTEEVTGTWRLVPADRVAADDEALALLVADVDPVLALVLLADAEDRRVRG